MILESIATTCNADGTTNIAPMGPQVTGEEIEWFELRPFRSSTTFQNLVARPAGVLNITDDVLLFTQAALDRIPGDVPLADAVRVDCRYLAGACRVYEFEVAHVNAAGPRATIQCRAVHSLRLRDFFGFNRARHLLIEATILVTRIDFVPVEAIRGKLAEFAPVIEKTGGPRELAALELLRSYVELPGPDSPLRQDSAGRQL